MLIPPTAPPLSARFANRQPRLLLVDADRRLVASLKRRLKRHQVEVAGAFDFETGEVEAERLRPHLAVVDWMLAGECGLELIPPLKALGSRVIICSGLARTNIEVEAIKRGAVDFLEKPVALARILTHLEHALDSHQASAAQSSEDGVTAENTLAYAKWVHIKKVLAATGGNIERAASVLDISRQGLHLMLKKTPPVK